MLSCESPVVLDRHCTVEDEEGLSYQSVSVDVVSGITVLGSDQNG